MHRGNYKRKNDNFHGSKRKKMFALEPGHRGFLCTCNGREKDCVKESYNILNDYVDKFYDFKKETETVKHNSGDEIEDELEKEIAQHNPVKSHGPRMFQVVDSGAKGCVFIKSTLEDPVDLAYKMMTDIAQSKQLKARFLLRLVPIEVTCKAYIDDIKKAADILFDKHFRCEPTTFSIVYNKRYNNNLLRDEIIQSLARIVSDKNINHKADLKQAKLSVIVEVMRNICCLSVIPDYFTLRKYNIAELAKDVTNEESQSTQSEVLDDAAESLPSEDETSPEHRDDSSKMHGLNDGLSVSESENITEETNISRNGDKKVHEGSGDA